MTSTPHSGDNENRCNVDNDKIAWLQNHMKAIGKEKAIVLFQHLGWDGQSTGEKNKAGNPLWWYQSNRNLLRDVICDRTPDPNDEDTNTDCSDPYNVVAVFSGHLHAFSSHGDILEGQGPRAIPNYVVDDAGHDLGNAQKDKDGHKQARDSGYYHVHINLSDGQANDAGQWVGQMAVNKIALSAPYDNIKGEDHIVSVNRYPYEPWKTLELTTAFLDWDQGEPSNPKDHCAEIKSNGRFNDVDCGETMPVLCYDATNKAWHRVLARPAIRLGRVDRTIEK